MLEADSAWPRARLSGGSAHSPPWGARMTPSIRDLPIVTATREGDGWRVALPAGDVLAEDDEAAARVVHEQAYGSAIRWVGIGPSPAVAAVSNLRPPDHVTEGAASN